MMPHSTLRLARTFPIEVHRSVVPHIFILRLEYAAFEECHNCQNKEHGPGDAHEDNHNGMKHVEASNMEDVAKSAKGYYPTNWRQADKCLAKVNTDTFAYRSGMSAPNS